LSQFRYEVLYESLDKPKKSQWLLELLILTQSDKRTKSDKEVDLSLRSGQRVVDTGSSSCQRLERRIFNIGRHKDMSNKVLIVGEKYSDLASTICDSMGYDSLVYGSEADNIGEVRDTDHLMLESYYPEYDRIVFTYDNGEKRASSILEMQKCLERGCKYRFNTPFLRHMDTINISPDAEIGEGCVIGAYVSIQAGSKIGIGTVIEEGTVIGANCVIGEGCTIGSDCLIEGGCKIGALSKIGSNTGIHEQSEIGYRSAIGSNCDIGEGCHLKPKYYLEDGNSLPKGFSR